MDTSCPEGALAAERARTIAECLSAVEAMRLTGYDTYSDDGKVGYAEAMDDASRALRRLVETAGPDVNHEQAQSLQSEASATELSVKAAIAAERARMADRCYEVVLEEAGPLVDMLDDFDAGYFSGIYAIEAAFRTVGASD